MALTLSALNETRLAYSHYQNIAQECIVARNQTKNAKKMYTLLKNQNSADLASQQQVVMAQLQVLIAKIDEDLLLANLSEALGELYLSSGFDVLPLEAIGATPPEVLKMIKQNFFIQDNMGFKSYVNSAYQTMFNDSKILSKK